MLDEQFNYLSQFSIFVKPVYGVISAESVDNPDFYKDSLEHAELFQPHFINYLSGQAVIKMM